MNAEIANPEMPTVVGEPVAESPAQHPNKKLGQWPEWFATFDFALVLLVAGLAFLVASYTVTNSDFWLNIATGRALIEGDYSLGSDPWSFSGAERVWVNHAWLSQLLMYAAYSTNPDGSIVVATKAIMVLLAFGLLFLLRQPGNAFLPWAFFGALGVLAVAPLIPARPAIVSLLFLSITMLLVYRMKWTVGSWRHPLIVAGLFLLWANCDDWFWLGPFYLVLVLVGDGWLHRLVTRETHVDAESFAIVPQAPPTSGLLKALGLGLLACTLNPTFIMALIQSPLEALTQSLPSELIVTIPNSTDIEFRTWGLTALVQDYYYNPTLGIRLNGVAYALLFGLGALSLLAGFRRVRATQILLWVGFGLLPLLQLRLLPYFVLVAVPIAAAQLNGLSRGIVLGPIDQARTKLTLMGSSLGRAFLLIALLGMVLASYPGWLNYLQVDRAHNRYLEWSLSPDAAMVRTAQRLQQWNDVGSLSNGSRGFNTDTEFGDYAAWYAPTQKMYINSRLGFHRTELSTVLNVRAETMIEQPKQGASDAMALSGTASDYVVVAVPIGQSSDRSLFNFEEKRYGQLWHLDGHSLIVGLPTSDVGSGLHFDVNELAYGVDVEPISIPPAIQPPLKADPNAYELYTLREETIPLTAADTKVYLDYKSYREREYGQLGAGLQLSLVHAQAPMLAPFLGVGQVSLESPSSVPLCVLAVRAAWQAVAQAPDRPEGYAALMESYSPKRAIMAPVMDLPYLGLSYVLGGPFLQPFNSDFFILSERTFQEINAGTRLLERLPPPEQADRLQKQLFFVTADRLMNIFDRTKQYDRARDTLRRLINYFKTLTPAEMQLLFDPQGRLEPKQLAEIYDDQLKIYEQLDVRFSNAVVKANQAAREGANPYDSLVRAIFSGAPMTAIELYNEVNESENKSEAYGPASVSASFLMVMLQLRAGQLYEATLSLDAYEEEIDKLRQQAPDSPDLLLFEQIRGLQARLAGDYPAAQRAMDRIEFPQLTQEQVDAQSKLKTAVDNSFGMALGGTFYHFYNSPIPDPYGPVIAEARNQYDRALIAVSAGDIPEAYRRLQLANKPNGFDIATIDPSLHEQIQRYLEPIQRVRETANE